jgi:hypothetical protein
MMNRVPEEEGEGAEELKKGIILTFSKDPDEGVKNL